MRYPWKPLVILYSNLRMLEPGFKSGNFPGGPVDKTPCFQGTWVRSLVSEVRSHILQLSLHASATGPAHSRATTPQWEKSTHHNKDPAQPSSPKKGTSKQQISILFIIWFQTSYLTILCISFSICRINIITASTLSRCYEHWMN